MTATGSGSAAQFERLADSVDAGGYSPAAEALRHAAEIVRLTGHATPVSVTIDGTPRSFLAVAEQIDFPNLVCSWPSDSGWVEPGDTIVLPPVDSTGVVPPGGGGGGFPGDTVCPATSSRTSQSLPSAPSRAPTPCGRSSPGSRSAWPRWCGSWRDIGKRRGGDGSAGCDDRIAHQRRVRSFRPPTPLPPDSGSGERRRAGRLPGFMGEYLVRDVGSWYAVEGSQANALEGITGACTDDRATIDWAEFDCEAARLRFEFSMRVEPVNWERLTGVAGSPGGPEGSHPLAMASSSVDGVRLTWVAWTPPPEPEPWPGPGPDPIPVDSVGPDGQRATHEGGPPRFQRSLRITLRAGSPDRLSPRGQC